MRLTSALGAIVFACLIVAEVGAVAPSQLTHQGRLTDATGLPIDGTVDLTFRLYDVPTGGTALAVETVPGVVVTDGLFSVQLTALADVDLYRVSDNGSWWLGVTVGSDTELQPRLLIAAMPFAKVSSSVDGDVQTRPGEFVISNPGPVQRAKGVVKGIGGGGSGTPASITFQCTLDDDADGVSEARWLMTSSLQGSSLTGGTDPDDDGDLDFVTVSNADGTRGQVTAAARDINNDGVYENNAGMQSTVTGVEMFRLADLDGDGKSERSITDNVTPSSATTVVAADLDADGTADRTVTTHSDGTDAGIAIAEEGIQVSMHSHGGGGGGGSGGIAIVAGVAIPKFINLTAQAQSAAEQADVGMVIGTGTDTTIRLETDDASSSLRLNGLPPGEPVIGTLSLTATGTQQEASGGHDSDGDGVNEFRWRQLSGPTAARSIVLADLDADGTPDRSVTTECDDGDAGIAISQEGIEIKTKTHASGPGGPASAEIAIAGGATTHCRWVFQNNETDLDMVSLNGLPPGEPVIGTFSVHTDAASSEIVLGDVTGDGFKFAVDNNSPPVVSIFEAGVERVVLDADGIAIDQPGVGKKVTVDADGIAINQPGVKIASMDQNGDCYLSGSLSLDVVSTSHVIEHSSGAHLTTGGVWTNASDANLKENFSEVDSDEVLDKIAELPIQRWNYKSEDASVTHIGPTAQDFNAAFRVGDDKTISTIDPAGVALAGIKQLRKENELLQQQVAELQRQLAELMKKLQK